MYYLLRTKLNLMLRYHVLRNHVLRNEPIPILNLIFQSLVNSISNFFRSFFTPKKSEIGFQIETGYL